MKKSLIVALLTLSLTACSAPSKNVPVESGPQQDKMPDYCYDVSEESLEYAFGLKSGEYKKRLEWQSRTHEQGECSWSAWRAKGSSQAMTISLSVLDEYPTKAFDGPNTLITTNEFKAAEKASEWGKGARIGYGLGSDKSDLTVVIPFDNDKSYLVMRAARSVADGKNAVSSTGRVDTGMAMIAADLLKSHGVVTPDLGGRPKLPEATDCDAIELDAVVGISEAKLTGDYSVDPAMNTCRWDVEDESGSEAVVTATVDSFTDSLLSGLKSEQIVALVFKAKASGPPAMDQESDRLAISSVEGSWEGVAAADDQLVSVVADRSDFGSDMLETLGRNVIEQLK